MTSIRASAVRPDAPEPTSLPSPATQIPPLVSEPAHKAFPAEVPHLAWHECAEMSHPYWDTSGWGVPPGSGVGAYFSGHQAEMRRAYYGAISWIDSLIGRALAKLDDGGLRNETVVAVTGDHVRPRIPSCGSLPWLARSGPFRPLTIDPPTSTSRFRGGTSENTTCGAK